MGETMKHDRDDDLAREIRAQVELETEERVAEGLSPDEALYAAGRAFGNTMRIREDARDVWTRRWVEQVQQDLLLAFRALCATPIVTIAAIVSLGLGIGANTAIFALVNSLLLRSLPVNEPSRLALMTHGTAGALRGSQSWTLAVWNDVRGRSQLFDSAFAWSWSRFNLRSADRPRWLFGPFHDWGNGVLEGKPGALSWARRARVKQPPRLPSEAQ
jgi:hypothetical protein